MQTVITLLGDSIFDNGPYVDKSKCVSSHITANKHPSEDILMLAVDGFTVSDAQTQIDDIDIVKSKLFLSIGGNDALEAVDILKEESTHVGHSLELIGDIVDVFKTKYMNLISTLLKINGSITLCTIYNKVPGLDKASTVALSLFNESILEVASTLKVNIIDLRVLLNKSELINNAKCLY